MDTNRRCLGIDIGYSAQQVMERRFNEKNYGGFKFRQDIPKRDDIKPNYKAPTPIIDYRIHKDWLYQKQKGICIFVVRYLN